MLLKQESPDSEINDSIETRTYSIQDSDYQLRHSQFKVGYMFAYSSCDFPNSKLSHDVSCHITPLT